MTTRPDTSPARRRPIVVAGVVTAILAAAAAAVRPAMFTRPESAAYDALTRWTPRRAPTGHVAIIDVDERSLSTFGQWPWRRDIVARLVDRLRDAGAAAIALDVVFHEPDSRAPTGDDPDTAFLTSIRRGRVVLGYGFAFGAASSRADVCDPRPVGIATLRDADSSETGDLFRATDTVCNRPGFADAAAGSGFLNAAPDTDGVLRRVPLLIAFGDRVYPSLALTAVSLTAQARDLVFRATSANSAELSLDGHVVPLDGRGNVLLRYRGRRQTFPHVSAADVANGQFAADAVAQKIVIVGATALGARESVTTPLDALFNGVEVQATVIDNLIARDSVARPASAPLTEAVATLLACLAVAFLWSRRGPAWGACAAIVGVVLAWVGAAWSLSSAGWFLSPIAPTIGLAAQLLATAAAAVAWERGRANRASTSAVVSQRLMVQSLLSLTEIRDATTGLHSRRTQAYARLLAERLAAHPRFCDFLTPDRVDLISSLAPLHDIGKVGIPDRLLNKPGLLTLDEMQEMRRHPVYGRDVLLRAQDHVGAGDDEVLRMAKEIVYTHHERWDGYGYPRGLRAEEIPIAGRVVTLVDVYDALTTRRVYREPLTHDIAVGLITAGRGKQFDPAVVDAFLAVESSFRLICVEHGVDTRRPAAV